MGFHKLGVAVIPRTMIRFANILAPLALVAGCATDGAYTGGDVGPSHFTQIGRAPASAARPTLPAIVEAPAGVSVDEARRRIETFLAQAGFQPESVARSGLYIISGERMASATGDGKEKSEAVCDFKALERPQMYTTHVDVRLGHAPPPHGPAAAAESSVQLGVDVKVVELDANLLSGAYSKQTCHSRGVLEAALRRAAFGG